MYHALFVVKRRIVTLFQRKALLFDSAFDNDRDGCLSALGVSQDVCPIDGDGVFNFPHGTVFTLAVDTKNAAGATAASEAAVAGKFPCAISELTTVFVLNIFFLCGMQGRTMRCCCF